MSFPTSLKCCVLLLLCFPLTGCQSGDDAVQTAEEDEINLELSTDPLQIQMPVIDSIIKSSQKEPIELDLRFVRENHIGAVLVNVSEMFDSTLFQHLPLEEPLADMLNETGVDLTKVDEMMLLISKPDPVQPGSEPVSIMKFKEPIDIESVTSKLVDVQTNQLADKTYYSSPASPIELFLDGKTLVVAPGGQLQSLLSTAEVETPLIDKLKSTSFDSTITVVALLEEVKEMIGAMGEQAAQDLPPMAASFLPMAEMLDTVVLRIDLSSDNLLNADFVASEDKVQQVEQMVGGLVGTGKMMYQMQRKGLSEGMPPELQQMVIPLLDQVMSGMNVVTLDNEVSFTLKRPASLDEHMPQLGEMLGMALADARAAAESVRQLNTLRQIGLAFHMYHSDFIKLPVDDSKPEYFAADGRPHLSWRVHILPYIEEQELFDRFHLNEPWDSPHNLTLLDQIPEIYQISEGSTDTDLLCFDGKGAAMVDGKGVGFRDILDGLSNTLAVVEAGPEHAVPWTKPEDLAWPADADSAFGDPDEDLFNALMIDGAVHRLPKTVTPEVLRSMITIDGTEEVDWASVLPR